MSRKGEALKPQEKKIIRGENKLQKRNHPRERQSNERTRASRGRKAERVAGGIYLFADKKRFCRGQGGGGASMKDFLSSWPQGRRSSGGGWLAGGGGRKGKSVMRSRTGEVNLAAGGGGHLAPQ